MASARYENKRSELNSKTAWLIHIHFDAFFDTPAKDFYFSTTTNIDFFLDGADREWKACLSETPQARHQRERGNDYSQFVLSNPHNDTYQDFLDYEDLIERGEMRLFQCLEIEPGYWEGEQRFYGFLKDFTINEKDKTLEFTAHTDMSRPGFLVGARILTRERCGTEFNFNGAIDPLYHPCGWQTAQGGNPLACSKFYTGVDSCTAHGNTHRFFAVQALSVAAIEFVPGGDIDFPYETNPCFTENNFILTPDWEQYSISQAKEGQKILAPDLYTGAPVVAEILKVDTHIVDNFLLAEFSRGGILEPTREHLFNIGGSTYAPIGSLFTKWVHGLRRNQQPGQERVLDLVEMAKRVAVYNLRTTAHTYFITDWQKSFFFNVHNSKQPVEL